MDRVLWFAWTGLRLGGACCLFAYLIFIAKSEQIEAVSFYEDLHQVRVIPPNEAPKVSQKSIDLAMIMFGIEVPNSSEYPILDRELTDRGLTSRKAFSSKVEIRIGPAAFASWGLLGSTLAHELEVHARQNFLFIYVMDVVGLDGTGEAERQAYLHELANANRFGLYKADAELIRQTMAYYYPMPKHPGARVTRAIRVWMARNLIQDVGTL